MLASILSLIALNNLLMSPSTPTTNQLEALTIKPPLISEVSAYPEKTTNSLGPILNAKSILSIDMETGKILYEKNTDEELPMASLTKLMTLLVIFDTHSPDEVVTVDKRATEVEPAKMNLLANEKITIDQLVKGIMVKSANDAALALAYYDSNDLDQFAAKMNAKAKELGMLHSHFVNPMGFDDPDQYTTADDLSIVARAAYKIALVQKYAPMSKATATSIDGKFDHDLVTTNELIGTYLHVIGLKTGTTDLAGQCLISIVISPTGEKIINIMLNSPARFTESKILAQWIFDNYHWL